MSLGLGSLSIHEPGESVNPNEPREPGDPWESVNPNEPRALWSLSFQMSLQPEKSVNPRAWSLGESVNPNEPAARVVCQSTSLEPVESVNP